MNFAIYQPSLHRDPDLKIYANQRVVVLGENAVLAEEDGGFWIDIRFENGVEATVSKEDLFILQT